MAAVARGEPGAFELVYTALQGKVYRQVLEVLRNRAQSEEVTQEVLLELWCTAGRYDPAKGTATGWAKMIAHRRAIDRVRSSAASAARDRQQSGSVPWDQTQETAENILDREALASCLAQLSGVQREAITLAFYGGRTYSQVAATLGVPLGTVKTRIRDGLIKLRSDMLNDE